MLEKYFRLIPTEDHSIIDQGDIHFMYESFGQPEIFEKYIDLLSNESWGLIISQNELSINFIEKHKDKILFDKIPLRYQDNDIVDYLLANYFEKLDVYELYRKGWIWTKERYLKYKDKINYREFTYLSNNFKMLSLKDIQKHKNEIDWTHFGDWYLDKKYYHLFKKYAKHIYWDGLRYHKLSSDFIIKFSKYLNFNKLVAHTVLSQKLIEKFSSQVDWDYISRYYVLTKPFIKKHYKKLSECNPDKFNEQAIKMCPGSHGANFSRCRLSVFIYLNAKKTYGVCSEEPIAEALFSKGCID